jgi:glycosyltransferase involved in cell wall biosynthesis
MHIAQLTADISEEVSGISQCVRALCTSLAASTDIDISVFAGTGQSKSPPPSYERVANVTISPKSFVGTYQALVRRHRQRPIDVIHDHGQWLPYYVSSAVFAQRFGIPRVVSSHGMISTQAFKHSRLQKKIAWSLYAKRCLNQARVIHVTSSLELNEVKKFSSRPTILIPLGFNPPPHADQLVDVERQKIVAFLGRIHPIKGIVELLAAWDQCHTEGWTLCIAGPDEANMFAGKTVPPNIKLLGSLNSTQKYEFLAQSTVLILPSHSENFGIVVPEALSVGTPVIAALGTPWSVLSERDIGWWVPCTVDSLATTLSQVMREPADRLREMGARAHQFAMQEFSWENIAQRFLAKYQELANERHT